MQLQGIADFNSNIVDKDKTGFDPGLNLGSGIAANCFLEIIIKSQLDISYLIYGQVYQALDSADTVLYSMKNE